MRHNAFHSTDVAVVGCSNGGQGIVLDGHCALGGSLVLLPMVISANHVHGGDAKLLLS